MTFILKIISELSVSVESSAIKSGDDAVLTCSIEATDVGQGIVWSMGETALSNSGGDYAIATTLGTAVEADLRTIISTSTLTINAFDAADVASYSCAVDYALPILDDSSVYLSISILGTCNRNASLTIPLPPVASL